jgi:hypothetical protein
MKMDEDISIIRTQDLSILRQSIKHMKIIMMSHLDLLDELDDYIRAWTNNKEVVHEKKKDPKRRA